MRGGFRYSFRKTSKMRSGRGKGKGPKKHHTRRHTRSHTRSHTRRHKLPKSRKHRRSMRGGSMQSLTPADINIPGQNTKIGGDQPHVGPNFNQSAGYGFKFSDPALGGSFQPNSQCEQY